eukprot:gene11180-18793_t
MWGYLGGLLGVQWGLLGGPIGSSIGGYCGGSTGGPMWGYFGGLLGVAVGASGGLLGVSVGCYCGGVYWGSNVGLLRGPTGGPATGGPTYLSLNTRWQTNVQGTNRLEALITAPAAVEEALASLLLENGSDTLMQRSAETYIRRLYHSSLLKGPLLQSIFTPPLSVTSHNPQDATSNNGPPKMTSLGSRLMSHPLPDLSEVLGATWLYQNPTLGEAERNGVYEAPCIGSLLLLHNMEQMKQELVHALDCHIKTFSADERGPVKNGTLHIALLAPTHHRSCATLAQEICTYVEEHHSLFSQLPFSTISVMVNAAGHGSCPWRVGLEMVGNSFKSNRFLQHVNCLSEVGLCFDKQAGGSLGTAASVSSESDCTQVFFTVLPLVPVRCETPQEEALFARSLRAAASSLVSKHITLLR